MLPGPAIDLITAILDNGSHVRDAIDARLRSSPDSRDGLSTPVWLPGALSQQHSLAEFLDLMTASGLLIIDHRGEYKLNTEAPHVRDLAARPLIALIAPRDP